MGTVDTARCEAAAGDGGGETWGRRDLLLNRITEKQLKTGLFWRMV